MPYADWHEHFAAYCAEFGFRDVDHVLSRYAESPLWPRWTAARRDIACEQVTYRWTGIDVGPIDGLSGPQTTAARTAYVQWQAERSLPSWRDGDPSWTADPVLPTKRDWPTQAQCSSFYGAPGYEVERQLVYVECPWPLYLAWATNTKVMRFKMHAKCADATSEVLESVYKTYGLNDIVKLKLHLWGGSYNLRKMRGGSSWSMHAYGCAIDWDPSRNALSTRAPAATLSRAEYAPWWAAWEAAGATSLGRARNFDWMHVQFADLS